MPAPTISGIVAAAGELSALPGSWQRLDAVLARESASSAQIAEVLATDPLLSARLLRLANSPLFGLAQRVERLSQAVHLIGTRQLRELALAATVVDLVAGAAGRRERVAAFLRHSVASGLLARSFAACRREGNVERFFVAGLLHDIGAFALELADTDGAAALRRTALARACPIEAAEREALGFDHAAVGSALLAGWRLPDALVEAVAWHHQPERAPIHRLEAAVTHVAATTADLLGLINDGLVVTPLDPRAWELLGLEPGDLPGICREAEDRLGGMLDALGGAIP